MFRRDCPAGYVGEAVKLAIARLKCCRRPYDCCQPPPEPEVATPATVVASAETNTILLLSGAAGFCTQNVIMNMFAFVDDSGAWLRCLGPLVCVTQSCFMLRLLQPTFLLWCSYGLRCCVAWWTCPCTSSARGSRPSSW